LKKKLKISLLITIVFIIMKLLILLILSITITLCNSKCIKVGSEKVCYEDSDCCQKKNILDFSGKKRNFCINFRCTTYNEHELRKMYGKKCYKIGHECKIDTECCSRSCIELKCSKDSDHDFTSYFEKKCLKSGHKCKRNTDCCSRVCRINNSVEYYMLVGENAVCD